MVDQIERELAGTSLVDGVTPAIIEQVAVQAPLQQTDGAASDDVRRRPRANGRFRSDRRLGWRGRALWISLGSGQVFLNRDAAEELGVGAGDRLSLFAGGPALRITVKDVVDYEGAGTSDSALLMPLAEAQALMGQPGQSRATFSSRIAATNGRA